MEKCVAYGRTFQLMAKDGFRGQYVHIESQGSV